MQGFPQIAILVDRQFVRKSKEEIPITSICLVRHGQTDWNALGKLQGKTDIPLNKTGIRQAEECSHVLQPEDWDALVTSPLKRARETGEIINQKLKLPVIVLDQFMERHFGEAEGLNVEQRTAMFPDKHYPGQEDLHIFRERLMDGLEHIKQEFPDGRVLLVAHGAVINELLAVLSNGELGPGKTLLGNACISNIQLQQEQWKILNYNQVSHLSVNQDAKKV